MTSTTRIRLVRLVIAFGLVALLGGSAAAAPGPAIVYVRTDCTGLSDCFTDTYALEAWLRDTRKPTAADPLLVDIGPGDFNGMYLRKTQHTTFRGSGQGVTRILKNACWGGTCDGVSLALDGVSNPPVSNVVFENMTLVGGIQSDAALDTTWIDIHISDASYYGWYDLFCTLKPAAQYAKHYWYSSKIDATGITNGALLGYQTHCGEHWFYGGEINVRPSYDAPVNHLGAVRALDGADFRAFGSALRVDTGAMTGGSAIGADAIYGVRLDNASVFHMHGGVINVDASGVADADVTGIRVAGAGTQFAHTPGTAFVLKPGGPNGTPTRTNGTPEKVQSPFLWQSGPHPPASGGSENNRLVSQDGADLFVETDCDSNGACGGGGNEAHLMIYNPAACTDPDNPWLDVVTGSCRVQ